MSWPYKTTAERLAFLDGWQDASEGRPMGAIRRREDRESKSAPGWLCDHAYEDGHSEQRRGVESRAA